MNQQSSSALRSADVVVLGGGVTGASAAYHLKQLGVKNIVLLERGPLASGVTGRSGAQLIPRSEHSIVAKLKWEGVRFYRDFEKRHGIPIGFRPSGYLAVAPHHEGAALAEDIKFLASLGSSVRRVTAAEVHEICRDVHMTSEEVGLTIPEAGFTDPVAVVRSLLKVSGAKVAEYTPAAIRVRGDAVTGVWTPEGEIATEKVIVTAGVWSNELLNPVGLGFPIFWHRAEVSFYRRPDDVLDHPIIGDFTQRFYFRPEIGGLTMAGSIPYMSTGITAPQGLERIDHPDAMRDGLKQETMRSLLEKLTVRIPRFAAGYWRRGHACVYDVTPDWHPIFSLEQQIRGLFAAAGFSGHGFVMSPAAGRLLAQAATCAPVDSSESRPFRTQRFVEGEPISFSIG